MDPEATSTLIAPTPRSPPAPSAGDVVGKAQGQAHEQAQAQNQQPEPIHATDAGFDFDFAQFMFQHRQHYQHHHEHHSPASLLGLNSASGAGPPSKLASGSHSNFTSTATSSSPVGADIGTAEGAQGRLQNGQVVPPNSTVATSFHDLGAEQVLPDAAAAATFATLSQADLDAITEGNYSSLFQVMDIPKLVNLGPASTGVTATTAASLAASSDQAQAVSPDIRPALTLPAPFSSEKRVAELNPSSSSEPVPRARSKRHRSEDTDISSTEVERPPAQKPFSAPERPGPLPVVHTSRPGNGLGLSSGAETGWDSDAPRKGSAISSILTRSSMGSSTSRSRDSATSVTTTATTSSAPSSTSSGSTFATGARSFAGSKLQDKPQSCNDMSGPSSFGGRDTSWPARLSLQHTSQTRPMGTDMSGSLQTYDPTCRDRLTEGQQDFSHSGPALRSRGSAGGGQWIPNDMSFKRPAPSESVHAVAAWSVATPVSSLPAGWVRVGLLDNHVTMPVELLNKLNISYSVLSNQSAQDKPALAAPTPASKRPAPFAASSPSLHDLPPSSPKSGWGNSAHAAPLHYAATSTDRDALTRSGGGNRSGFASEAGVPSTAVDETAEPSGPAFGNSDAIPPEQTGHRADNAALDSTEVNNGTDEARFYELTQHEMDLLVFWLRFGVVPKHSRPDLDLLILLADRYQLEHLSEAVRDAKDTRYLSVKERAELDGKAIGEMQRHLGGLILWSDPAQKKEGEGTVASTIAGPSYQAVCAVLDHELWDLEPGSRKLVPVDFRFPLAMARQGAISPFGSDQVRELQGQPGWDSLASSSSGRQTLWNAYRDDANRQVWHRIFFDAIAKRLWTDGFVIEREMVDCISSKIFYLISR